MNNTVLARHGRASRIAPLTIALWITACSPAVSPCSAHAPADVAPPPATEAPARAKYFFYFIGDGMGPNQVYSAQLFKTVLRQQPLVNGVAPLSFTGFPAQGLVTTYCDGSAITDSAAAGTALASGHKTAPGVLGLKPDLTTQVKSMARMAKEQGMRVGILSTVSLDHATPAAFYAHQPSRESYYEIALQAPASGFDFFAGGGFKRPVPRDNPSAPSIWVTIENAGYQLARTTEEHEDLKLPAFAINEQLDDKAAMPYEIDRQPDGKRLADYTRQAIELLRSDKGFFVMVEGGKIDWACHANDAVTAMHETLEFASAVQVAVEFMARHPQETVIVVTADHETGGMGLGHTGTGYKTYFEKLKHQRMSFRRFQAQVQDFIVEHPEANLEELLPLVTANWGLTVAKDAKEQGKIDAAPGAGYSHQENVDHVGMVLTSEELQELRAALDVSKVRIDKHQRNRTLQLAYGEYDPFTVTLTHLLDRRAGIYWTTYYHTAAAVPVFAAGVGHARFDAVLDNTQVATHLIDLMSGSK